MCRQDADHGAGVVQLTGHHGLVGLVKVDPADRHAVLPTLTGESLAMPDADEVPGKEYAQSFRDTSGRTEVVDEDVPAAGDQVSLLVKLAGRAQPGRLPRDIEQTGGQLPLERTDRVAILLDQQHLVTAGDLSECHDRDRTRVVDILAPDRAGLTEVDGVAPDVPDHTLEHHRAVQDRTLLEPVGQVNATQDLGIQTHCAATVSLPLGLSTSTRREALWASRAAPTNPAKSGCARVGRDRNSGWAWVAT